MQTLTQLQCPAPTKKRKVRKSFLGDDSVVMQPQLPTDSMSPLPPPMPTLTQLQTQCPTPTKKRKKKKVCRSFLSDDSFVQQPQIPEDTTTPLPQPKPSVTQPCKEHFRASIKWKVRDPFVNDNSIQNQDDPTTPQYPPPSKKQDDSAQQMQSAEESVLLLPPQMLQLTEMPNPDDSCVEGFAVSTPVLEGGYFPIITSNFEKLPVSEQQLNTYPLQQKLKELTNNVTQSQS